MVTSPSFWCLGDNTVDQYVGASARRMVGGNALNVAVQLHRLGRRVAYCGAVGDDDNGRWIREEIARAGLEDGTVHSVRGESAVTIVRVDAAGERYFEREDFGVTADFIPPEECLSRAANASWVHLGMLPHAARVKASLHKLNPSIRISQDCGVTPGGEALAVGFTSAGEDGQRARAACLKLHAEGARLAVATMGGLGSIAFNGHRWWSQPALEAAVVDTTGAGDSYIAGFISARGERLPVGACMHAGAVAAATTCGHLGGFPQAGE